MDIDSQIKEIDDELRPQVVPMNRRPLICFKRIYGSVIDEAERARLFEPINAWYSKTYGEKFFWDGTIAVYPVLVRGEMFSSRVMLPEGNILIDYKEVIDGLPEALKGDLHEADFAATAERMQQANQNWRYIYNLTVDDTILPVRARDLVERGLHDLENSGVTLSKQHDLQTGMVQAHEAAEKFIKAGLIYAGYPGEVEKFRHNLERAYKELSKLNVRYAALPKPTEALAKHVPDMQLRYAPSLKTGDDAVSAYHSALYICGMLSRIWVLDLLRGTTVSDFEPGLFYETPIGNFAYCKLASGDKVVLLNFRELADNSLIFDIHLSQQESSLYLKVADEKRDGQLRNELLWYLRTCNRRVTESESNVALISDREGSYAVARMKVRITKSS